MSGFLYIAQTVSMTSKALQHLLLLYERPLEPVFVPKGDQQVFDVPEEYLVERYRPLQEELNNRFGENVKERISVKKINIPDLSVALGLGRQDNFSLFIPSHRKMASTLIEQFMSQPTLEDFTSFALYARDRVNSFLFFYAYSVAILHRKDTRNVPVPSFAEVFPEKYMDSAVFSRAKEESTIVQNSGERMPLIIPRDYTASDLEEEHRVAYFREDIGINLHHWHWHLVYPTDAPREIVNKDRRGELFFYMHQQIMARYNFERFSMNLARTKRLLNWREPIPEGYFPKLDSLVSSRVWAPRNSNTILSDINREVEQIRFDIGDMERWRDRFYQAIHIGSVVTADGKIQPLDEETGIDTLGNMMEASILTINQFVYGDLHNRGHVAISLSHDPDNRHLETFGVMGDPATAMRDPVFYRWHAFVDDIFQEHKNLLPRYTVDQLNYNGVTVTSAQIKVQGQPDNLLVTLWQQSDIDLSRGLDFTPRGNVFARFTHLQHIPFSYKITVENNGQQRMGTCRIFLAPKFDERGLPFLFRDQKGLFIEMDKFTVNLKPKTNVIERKSKESSVTIPFNRTFRNLEANRPDSGPILEAFNFCGCGWPEHMLVPRGTPQGLQCQLFVMISNYENDRVERSTVGGKMCEDAASSYCGLRDNKYPDKRSMGYPFDRLPRDGVNLLQEFITPNMAVVDVSIRHLDRTVSPKKVGVNEAPRG
ncbi:phenoloxidase 2-like isoform X2 [Macrosteles quadrilineatus]|uniref:phenoloxidase 2-like isoform X2 n=1 Tax=Macrosteles quadrilineatus TaxID=74068 RepID=UPI0023E2582D|nr:phenoloxidase 2-like isoform X2 [Macrosteles quadrilineatus]